MKRGEWHEAARTIHAANPDWSYSRIARFLGVTHSAVWKLLNPERALEVSRRDNARPERKRAKRAFDREYDRRPEVRGECGNPCCKNLRGIGHGDRSRRGYCSECARAVADVRQTLTEGMWAEGWTVYEIEAALGVNSRGGYVGACRARGWDLPHRRTPEQIERIAAGRRDREKAAA